MSENTSITPNNQNVENELQQSQESTQNIESPAKQSVPKLQEASIKINEEVKPENVIIAVPVEKNFEEFAKQGLDILINKYLEDGIIDNDELVDLVKTSMEIVEGRKELEGQEKKKVALLILRQFIQDKVNDYDNLEKLFSKAIDLAVKVSKDGLEKIKFSSETISDTKSAFNLIYASTMTKINEAYPLADDIINNIFDIALYVMQLIEGQTGLSENERKILLKKIIQKVINSLETKLTSEQRDFLLTQVEPTISLVQIALRAQKGQIQINPEEVIGFFACLMGLFRKCCKKNNSPSKNQ